MTKKRRRRGEAYNSFLYDQKKKETLTSIHNTGKR